MAAYQPLLVAALLALAVVSAPFVSIQLGLIILIGFDEQTPTFFLFGDNTLEMLAEGSAPCRDVDVDLLPVLKDPGLLDGLVRDCDGRRRAGLFNAFEWLLS